MDRAMTEQIAARAYERYLERGGRDGHDVEDWLAAEAELRTSEYDVVLVDPGPREIELVREIRDVTGLSLRAFKALLEARPRAIKQAPYLEAQELQSRLQKFGASIELRALH
jgi:ribosomal protein L7/L12